MKLNALSYRQHVNSYIVKSNTYNALLYLKKNNSLYHGTVIVLGNIPENLLSLLGNDIKKSEKIDTLEEDGNFLGLHRFDSQGTMV